jgi:hypothetical protein
MFGVACTGVLPTPTHNENSEPKRRLTAEVADGGSLTERVTKSDEKGMDLSALTKELAVQVEILKNEGKYMEVENENKRLEWAWLDLVSARVTHTHTHAHTSSLVIHRKGKRSHRRCKRSTRN